jgi:hypothetical protein
MAGDTAHDRAQCSTYRISGLIFSPILARPFPEQKTRAAGWPNPGEKDTEYGLYLHRYDR